MGVLVDSVQSHRLTFKAEVEDYNVTAGTENQVDVVITNTGDVSVYDVDARLSSTSPNIVILEELSGTFSLIEPNCSVSFTPTIGVSETTMLGTYPLTLTLKYKDPDGVSGADSIIMGVLVDSVKPKDRTTMVVQGFQMTPTEAHPGDELVMKVDLKNLEAEAYDVRAELVIDPQVPLVSLVPTLIFVGNMESNQTDEVVYNLLIEGDAKAQPYTIQLVISYYDLYDQPNSITETISISVRSIASFRLLDVKPSPLTVEPGGTATIEADLLLIGTEMVEFVEIEIVENSSINPFISTTESYEYIGHVDPDSPVPFEIQFKVDSNAAPGSHLLQMRVNYRDECNQERRATIELPVTVEELTVKNQDNAITLWDLIDIIARILLGLKP
jgi:hypothetical protein